MTKTGGGGEGDASRLRLQLRAALEEMRTLAEFFLAHDPIFPAYIYENPRRCGNPGCECATGKLHSAWVIRGRKGSLARTVSEAERGELEPLTRRYREFRQARQRVVGLQREVLATIDSLERARSVNPVQPARRARRRR